jgi:hypothetical protein
LAGELIYWETENYAAYRLGQWLSFSDLPPWRFHLLTVFAQRA